MQIEISFKNVESSDRLKDFTKDKIERLNKFFDGKIHIRWAFAKEHGTYIANVHATGQDLDTHVESESENLFTLVEDAVDKLERILQKSKEQSRDHRRG